MAGLPCMFKAPTTEESSLWSQMNIQDMLLKLKDMDHGTATNKRPHNEDDTDVVHINMRKSVRVARSHKKYMLSPPDAPTFVIPSGTLQPRKKGAPRPFHDMYERAIEEYRKSVSACYPVCHTVCCTKCRLPPPIFFVCHATSNNDTSRQLSAVLRILLSSGNKRVAISNQRRSPVAKMHKKTSLTATSPHKGNRVVKKKALGALVASYSTNIPFQTLLRGWEKNPEFQKHVKKVSSTPQQRENPLEGITIHSKSAIWYRHYDLLPGISVPGPPILVPSALFVIPNSTAESETEGPPTPESTVPQEPVHGTNDTDGASNGSRRASVSSDTASDISSIDEESRNTRPEDVLTESKTKTTTMGDVQDALNEFEALATPMSPGRDSDSSDLPLSTFLAQFEGRVLNETSAAATSSPASPAACPPTTPTELPKINTTTIPDVQCALYKFEAVVSLTSPRRSRDSSDLPLSSFLAQFEGRLSNEPSTAATSLSSEGECESESDDASTNTSTLVEDSSENDIINALKSFHVSPVSMDDIDESNVDNDQVEIEQVSTPTEIQVLPAMTGVESSTDTMVAADDSADENESDLSGPMVVARAPISPLRRLAEILVLPLNTEFQPFAAFMAVPDNSMALGVYAPAWDFLRRLIVTQIVDSPSVNLTIGAVDTFEILPLPFMDGLLSLAIRSMRLSLPFPLTSALESINAYSPPLLSSDTITSTVESIHDTQSHLLCSDTVTSDIESSAFVELDSSSTSSASLSAESADMPSDPDSPTVSDDTSPAETASPIITPSQSVRLTTVPTMSTSFIPSTLSRSVYIDEFSTHRWLLACIRSADGNRDDQSIDD